MLQIASPMYFGFFYKRACALPYGEIIRGTRFVNRRFGEMKCDSGKMTHGGAGNAYW